MSQKPSAELKDPRSLAEVNTALTTFLDEPNPSIIALTGRWGRGKTYFWREFLRKRRSTEKDPLYSYISLFGLGDLQQLKDAVFENAGLMRETETPTIASASPSGVTIRSLVDRARALPRQIIQLGTIAEKFPKLSEFGPFARAVAFSLVKGYVVCIDDLERRGTQLPLRDVLGFATLLRDQKGCRVIVILNSDALGEDKDEYERLREKVFDYEMVFEPSAEECAAIAFPDGEGPFMQAKLNATVLGITNIRVLFRIRRLLEALLHQAGEVSATLKHQLVHSGVLLGWSYNTRDGTAPAYEYIKTMNYSRIVARVIGKKEPDEAERQWDALLEAYEFNNTDDLDLAICNTLQRGFANTSDLQRILADREQAETRAVLEGAFHDAWQIYHGGFGEDEERLANAFIACFDAAPELISLVNASSTITLLRELGKEEVADDLIRKWIEAAKSKNPQALDLDRNHWKEDARDPKFVAAIKEAYAAVAPPLRALSEVAADLATKNGWSEDDVRTLVAASEDDYYFFFKRLSGPDTRSIIRACLRFSEIGGNEDYKLISGRVCAALRRLAGESALNANRIESFGLASVPKTEDEQ